VAAASQFRFVPFGKDAPPRAAACDGLVPNAALDLSHWEGNATPAELKRDTSVEIALAFARSGGTVDLAVNNHFDADGALAVFALVRSDVALAHEKLFVAAAEAGDFDEWSDERGIKLEATVRRLGMLKTEADAYARVISDLESILPSIDRREDLWGSAWAGIEEAEAKLARGDVHVFTDEAGTLATIVHRRNANELPGPVIDRAIKKLTAKRPRAWLLAFERDGGTERVPLYDYRFEQARYAWADTVVRPPLAAPSRHAIANAIGGDAWAFKGDLGMTGLLRTKAPIASSPDTIARAIVDRAFSLMDAPRPRATRRSA
jgi:hypothetical protein